MIGPDPHGLAALLMLSDGRLPTGGHATSGGVEWAACHDDLADPAVLEAWVHGRLVTSGTVEAAFAVAAAAATPNGDVLENLDAELTARIVGGRARTISRQTGRQFVRAAARVWIDPAYALLSHRDGPHLALAIGVTASVLRLSPEQTAVMVLHQLTATAVTSAVKMLGIDPIEAAATQARLGATIETITAQAADWVETAPADLPARSSPVADVYAEDHGTWSARLFVA